MTPPAAAVWMTNDAENGGRWGRTTEVSAGAQLK